MITYLDASAAMKLLVDEPESAALEAFVTAFGNEDRLVASWLLHTELHCAAGRHPDQVSREDVNLVLDAVSLVDLTRGDLLTAATLPGRLCSADALHLAVALRCGVDRMLTYDAELARAADLAGLASAQPACGDASPAGGDDEGP